MAEQRSVITKIIASLNVGGIFIFSFDGINEADSHTNNTKGPEVYYSSLGVNRFISLVIDLDCKIKHFEYDQRPELHSYLIVEKS